MIAPEDHPEEKGREVLLIVSENTHGMTLKQCYKEYVSDWYDDQHQGTTISEGNTTINSKQAKWMEYQFGMKGSMISLVYLIYCDEKLFLISKLSSSKQSQNTRRSLRWSLIHLKKTSTLNLGGPLLQSFVSS